MLAGASALLMILVCINIASLLGQHAARRRREVAIRTALGAVPSRIASQVLVETGILASAGALMGWVASLWLSKALYFILPNFGFPIAFNLRSDIRAEVFVARSQFLSHSPVAWFPCASHCASRSRRHCTRVDQPLPALRASGSASRSFSEFSWAFASWSSSAAGF
ncbi:FtsX-like permease family protein [Alloacidobacterium dinghuense]|uniref:FtsX-like permease family protein n=1 Tax=Alloacidobacterium dinghuense TaxID=2763107 RepID=UPI003D8086B3